MIDFEDMMRMQRELYELHKGEWEPLEPQNARHRLLWLVEELGEMIAVIKKKGDEAILRDPAVRENFCAEAADVLMYLNDVLLCYGVTGEEISGAYQAKHQYDMKRDYREQNRKLYIDRVLTEELPEN